MTTRRRIGAGAWLALGLVVGLPGLAEAQLFPNRTIQRQRESCAKEPPFNAHVRRDFYGYYPTCWTRFPSGFACPCPNPELPNAAASFARQPLELQPRDPIGGPDDAMNPEDRDRPADPDMPGADPNVPALPRTRSPFDIDPRPDAAPDPAPPAAPGTRPRPPAAGPGAARTITPPVPGVNPEAPAPASSSTSLLEMPSIPTPPIVAESRLEPGAMALAPDATLASNSGGDRPDLGPLPSGPAPPVSMPSNLDSPSAPSNDPAAPAAPAQAPKRRGLLSNLFGNKTRR